MKRFAYTFSLIISILYVLCCSSKAEAGDFEIPPSIRFTLDREPSTSPIIYYFSKPDLIDTSYPILIICDGSLSKGNLTSVLFMRQHPALASRVEPLNIGCLTIEK